MTIAIFHLTLQEISTIVSFSVTLGVSQMPPKYKMTLGAFTNVPGLILD